MVRRVIFFESSICASGSTSEASSAKHGIARKTARIKGLKNIWSKYKNLFPFYPQGQPIFYSQPYPRPRKTISALRQTYKKDTINFSALQNRIYETGYNLKPLSKKRKRISFIFNKLQGNPANVVPYFQNAEIHFLETTITPSKSFRLSRQIQKFIT